MCHTTKHCQSSRLSPSQSARSTHSCSCSCRCRCRCCCRCSCGHSINRIHSHTLLLALAALLLMPLTHARRLHDQLALGFASEDADSSSASSSAISSSSSDSSAALPAWHANPFHGLAQSFGDASYDSDASSKASASGSAIDAESDSSYEQITQSAVQAAMRELRRQRIRHRRSHTLRYFARSQQDSAPEWENPCGGVYQPEHTQPQEADVSMRVTKRKYLMALSKNTLVEYVNIRRDANLDYGDIQPWMREYKFLPNMTRPTNVAKLKTWYRNMQTFVGSFAYLGKAHYKYQKEHQLPLGQTTEELHMLLVSARTVLCEIETTINASYPHANAGKLSQVSRAAMQERLKFYTPADGSKETDVRDLKFTKQLYFQHLDNMWKSLNLAQRKHRNSHERRGHSSSSTSNSRQTYSLESSESGSSAAGSASASSSAAANSNGCSSSGSC